MTVAGWAQAQRESLGTRRRFLHGETARETDEPALRRRIVRWRPRVQLIRMAGTTHPKHCLPKLGANRSSCRAHNTASSYTCFSVWSASRLLQTTCTRVGPEVKNAQEFLNRASTDHDSNPSSWQGRAVIDGPVDRGAYGRDHRLGPSDGRHTDHQHRRESAKWNLPLGVLQHATRLKRVRAFQHGRNLRGRQHGRLRRPPGAPAVLAPDQWRRQPGLQGFGQPVQWTRIRVHQHRHRAVRQVPDRQRFFGLWRHG